MEIRKHPSLSRRAILALSLILIVSSGCSKKCPVDSPYDQPTPLLLKIGFADESLSDLIRRVVLTVRMPETGTSIQTDLTLRDGQISGSVEVPAGEGRLFTLEARDSSNTVIYRGDTTSAVMGGQITELTITLFPAVFLLKLSPVYQEVSNSDSFFVDAKLYGAQNLFGVSFRVESDPAALLAAQVFPGDFLGPADSTIFFSKVDTLAGYAAVGYSKIRGSSSGVSGSGKLARIYFKSLTEGPGENPTLASIIFNRETLIFYDANGENPGLKDSVYIHDAEVWIR